MEKRQEDPEVERGKAEGVDVRTQNGASSARTLPSSEWVAGTEPPSSSQASSRLQQQSSRTGVSSPATPKAHAQLPSPPPSSVASQNKPPSVASSPAATLRLDPEVLQSSDQSPSPMVSAPGSKSPYVLVTTETKQSGTGSAASAPAAMRVLSSTPTARTQPWTVVRTGFSSVPMTPIAPRSHVEVGHHFVSSIPTHVAWQAAQQQQLMRVAQPWGGMWSPVVVLPTDSTHRPVPQRTTSMVETARDLHQLRNSSSRNEAGGPCSPEQSARQMLQGSTARESYHQRSLSMTPAPEAAPATSFKQACPSFPASSKEGLTRASSQRPLPVATTPSPHPMAGPSIQQRSVTSACSNSSFSIPNPQGAVSQWPRSATNSLASPGPSRNALLPVCHSFSPGMYYPLPVAIAAGSYVRPGAQEAAARNVQLVPVAPLSAMPARTHSLNLSHSQYSHGPSPGHHSSAPTPPLRASEKRCKSSSPDRLCATTEARRDSPAGTTKQGPLTPTTKSHEVSKSVESPKVPSSLNSHPRDSSAKSKTSSGALTKKEGHQSPAGGSRRMSSSPPTPMSPTPLRRPPPYISHAAISPLHSMSSLQSFRSATPGAVMGSYSGRSTPLGVYCQQQFNQASLAAFQVVGVHAQQQLSRDSSSDFSLRSFQQQKEPRSVSSIVPSSKTSSASIQPLQSTAARPGTAPYLPGAVCCGDYTLKRATTQDSLAGTITGYRAADLSGGYAKDVRLTPIQRLQAAEQEATRIVEEACEHRAKQLQIARDDADAEVEMMRSRFKAELKALTEEVEGEVLAVKALEEGKAASWIAKMEATAGPRIADAASYVAGLVLDVNTSLPEGALKTYRAQDVNRQFERCKSEYHSRTCSINLGRVDTLMLQDDGSRFIQHEDPVTRKISITKHGSFWTRHRSPSPLLPSSMATNSFMSKVAEFSSVPEGSSDEESTPHALYRDLMENALDRDRKSVTFGEA